MIPKVSDLCVLGAIHRHLLIVYLVCHLSVFPAQISSITSSSKYPKKSLRSPHNQIKTPSPIISSMSE